MEVKKQSLSSTPLADSLIQEIEQVIDEVGKSELEAVNVAWQNKTRRLIGIFFEDCYDGETKVQRHVTFPPRSFEYQVIFATREGMKDCLRALEYEFSKDALRVRYVWHSLLPRYRKNKKSVVQKESK